MALELVTSGETTTTNEHRVRDALNSGGVPASEVIDRVARAIPCPFCGASSGTPCVTTRGARRLWEHAPRWRRAVAIIEGDT